MQGILVSSKQPNEIQLVLIGIFKLFQKEKQSSVKDNN